MKLYSGLFVVMFAWACASPRPSLTPKVFSPTQGQVYIEVLRDEVVAGFEGCHCEWDYDLTLDALKQEDYLLEHWDQDRMHPVFRKILRDALPAIALLTGQRSHAVRLATALAEDTTITYP